MNFKEGSIIKGKDLQKYVLCKILPENMMSNGFQYTLGKNIDILPFSTQEHCKNGLYFLDMENIFDYFDRGTKLAIIKISDNEDVYVDKCCSHENFRTHSLTIEKVMPLNESKTWELLRKKGFDIQMNDNFLFEWSASHGYLELVKYLHENGVDIACKDNYAIKISCEKGYLEQVKYLHENGADITTNNNYPIILATLKEHFDIVKYLYENGARNKEAIKIAKRHKNKKIIKYFSKKN